MSIACPYCGATLNPKGVKPGHFKPKCPKCQQTFALTVSDDADDPFTVERLEPDPLPPTKAVPLAKLRARQFSDDDEGEAAEAPEGEGDSEDIANDDDGAENPPLPKTSPYPMVRPKKPPVDEEDV